MFNATMAGIIGRHFLTGLGGYFVSTGRLDPSQSDTIIGAVTIVIGLVWSWAQKHAAAP